MIAEIKKIRGLKKIKNILFRNFRDPKNKHKTKKIDSSKNNLENQRFKNLKMLKFKKLKIFNKNTGFKLKKNYNVKKSKIKKSKGLEKMLQSYPIF